MKIKLGIEPLPQPRPRFANGRAYEESRIKTYKASIAIAAKVAMAGKAPLSSPVAVSIVLFREIKSTARRYGDCDNHCKAILDALNGICYLDDSQIIKLTVEKNTGAPCLEIEVLPV